MNTRLRIAAVSFLNARPITYGLERGLGEDRFELRFALPSRCAELLATGEADLALLPTASYVAHPGELRVVPGVAVAGRGPVRTVLLVGERPWHELTSVALDGASRSSAALLKLLMRERGLSPAYEEVEHEGVLAAATGERGALIIGDAGFEAPERYPHVYDLGREWTTLTGLPFVYALWAGRPEAVGPEEVALLRESLRSGLAHRGEIARGWAEARGIDPAVCEAYLQHNIRYQLGAEELSGAAAFIHRASVAGLLPKKALRFYDDGRAERPITTAKTAPPLPVPVSAPVRPAGNGRGSVDALLADAAAGGRLDLDEAVRLYHEAPALELGAAADARRRQLHGDGVVTYIIDRNVNYTNVCVTRCKFCNFYRPPGHKEGYTLSRDELGRKLAETVELGGVQILLQGGLNPELPLAYYEDLFRWMKASFPLAIHGLSPEEIRYIAELERLPIRTVLERLVAAGLDSVPGGGRRDPRRRRPALHLAAEVLDRDLARGHAPGARARAADHRHHGLRVR